LEKIAHCKAVTVTAQEEPFIWTAFDYTKGGQIFMALTKIEIVNMLYEHIGLPKNECVRIVESFFDIIKSELEKGNSIMVSGFGKWTVNSKKARRGRNPQTGKDLTIDARKVVTFKPSAVLRDEMNANK
jgi:integration host factor subunit alpha